MTPESSWRQIGVKFLQGADGHPDLYAHWDGGREMWTLRLAQAHQPFQPANPEAERLFVETAQMAVQLMRTSRDPDTRAFATSLRKAWHIWLDFMRMQQRGFRQIEKPRTWTQFKKAIEGAPVLTDSKDGGIRNVFKESAEFCKDLAAAADSETAARVVSDLPEVQERLDDSRLPDLAPDAAERIAEALKDARAHVSGNANETRGTQAMALYLDSIAWEYALTQSSTAFEALIDGISAKARDEFAGDLAVAKDRRRYWIKEAQERAANGIVGRVIPIRVAANQTQIFHDLELQFRNMPGTRGDLQVIFFDETRFNVFSNYPDPTDDILERQKFELLARQGMAALDFRFADSSRAIFYWLQFLKQKSPHFKQWKCRRLCAASADFCAELKTRARESAPRGTEVENAGVAALPQSISPESIPSGQYFGPPLQNLSPVPIMPHRTTGNPIVHVDLFSPLRRHSIVAGANGPAPSLCDELRDEIIRIADRIQAVENPDLPPAEAGDRWLDRLSRESPAVWELRDVLNTSVIYCQTFATYLIRRGNPGLATQFDGFAKQFDALRNKYLTARRSPQLEDSTKPLMAGDSLEVRQEIELPASDDFTTLTGTDWQAQNWSDVEICFVSDQRVQITVGMHNETLNYAEFGFEDRRSGAPSLAWLTLRVLAEARGILYREQNGREGTRVEKRMQAIRATFRNYFKLQGDPLPLIKGIGYKTQFRISSAPAYNS